jgi:hypothetical protein
VVDLEAGSTTTCWMARTATWNKNRKANQKKMVAWLQSFSTDVKAKIGRLPLIYTNANWWNTCTGGSSAFRANGLFLAAYGVKKPTLPKGWTTYAFWQWRDATKTTKGYPGDQDVFKGSVTALKTLARPPLHAGTVRITGKNALGGTLKASVSGWPKGAKLSYQWYLDGKLVKGATYSTTHVTKARIGRRLTVVVRGALGGYTSSSRTSAALTLK